jgi:DNA-binding winged helix-turn-helix (wHTH) protein/Tfp pilus assembly protein PilF
MFWQAKTNYEFGPFRLEAGERQLLRNGQVVPLTPKVFDVLLALVQHHGHIMSKDEVMRLVWPNTAVEEGNLARNISTLRNALGERPQERRYIETIPWRGYRFIAAVKQVQAQESRAPIESIAVLPFVNVNANAKLDYLADGIAETLANRLARLTDLRVTSRNSSFRYKNCNFSAPAIGRELNVQALLVGRVAESSDLLSISVELIESASDRHLWGAQYIRQRADLFEAQETITSEIVDKLRVELSSREEQILARRSTENRKAYVSFLQGRYHFHKLTPGGVQKGAEYFQRAIKLDPDYALAYAGLADCYTYLAKPDEAKKAVRKALELDDHLGEAHATLGFFSFLYDWDFARAESEFVRALALNHNYAEAHHWYAIYLANVGRHEEAFREAEMAVELDPLSLLMMMTAALNFYTGREYKRAMARLQKVIEMDANFPAAHSVLGCVYSQMQMYEKALAEFEKVMELCQGAPVAENSVKVLKAQVYARWGKPDEANKLIREVGDGPVSSYSVAGVFAALGNLDQAFELLNQAYEQHDMQLVSLMVDPSLDGIRDDPRFGELVHRIGLPV